MKTLAPIAAVLGCAACGLQPAGPLQHDSVSFDRDKADQVRVTLQMGGGDLKVDSGTDKLATADFDYNVPEWKPEATYRSAGGVGALEFRQHEESGTHFRNTKNDWDIHLNREVPMEVMVHMGAGDATLKLGGLALRRVELEMGAGDLKMDLRGSPQASYDVKIRGGAGDATIHFPDSVGLEGTATGGVGEISADGFHNEGNRYTNDAAGKSKVTIHFDVAAGVGDLRLISGK